MKIIKLEVQYKLLKLFSNSEVKNNIIFKNKYWLVLLAFQECEYMFACTYNYNHCTFFKFISEMRCYIHSKRRDILVPLLCLVLITVKYCDDINLFVHMFIFKTLNLLKSLWKTNNRNYGWWIHLYPCSEGHYSVSDVLLQKTPQVPYSCFKSTTSRIQPPVRNNIPGPGTYNPYQPPEPVKRTVLP